MSRDGRARAGRPPKGVLPRKSRRLATHANPLRAKATEDPSSRRPLGLQRSASAQPLRPSCEPGCGGGESGWAHVWEGCRKQAAKVESNG